MKNDTDVFIHIPKEELVAMENGLDDVDAAGPNTPGLDISTRYRFSYDPNGAVHVSNYYCSCGPCLQHDLSTCTKRTLAPYTPKDVEFVVRSRKEEAKKIQEAANARRSSEAPLRRDMKSLHTAEYPTKTAEELKHGDHDYTKPLYKWQMVSYLVLKSGKRAREARELKTQYQNEYTNKILRLLQDCLLIVPRQN